MGTTAEVSKQPISKPDSSGGASVMFVDWASVDPSQPNCSLLDGTDFSEYRIVFFDPWQFAVTNGLRSADKEGTDVEYIPFSENEFLRYLTQIKGASQSLQRLLKNDGTLVLRSRVPKSHIKVHKKSSASVRQYTKSVVSAFFWLDDILGQSFFQDCSSKVFKFIHSNSPLADVFGNTAIDCRQTQNSIGKGKTTVVAVGGPALKSPIITRITYAPEPGQVYLIPRFLVEDEQARLTRAFVRIVYDDASGLDRPAWVEFYDRQVKEYNPVKPKMERLELEIKALLKQKTVLVREAAKINLLSDLMCEKSGRLRRAAEIAFKILGFEIAKREESQADDSFRAAFGDDERVVAQVKTSATDSGPIPISDIAALTATKVGDVSVSPGKLILVGNASRIIAPEKRAEWFGAGCGETAAQNHVCLLSTQDLYDAACLVLSKTTSESLDKIKSGLCSDLIACIGIFQINRAKYGI